MPDSYGKPLCSSPRLRWEISHAAPIVMNTNETPAKANPTTYQMLVNPTPLRLAPTGQRHRPLRTVSERTAVPGWSELSPPIFYRGSAVDGAGAACAQRARGERGDGWRMAGACAGGSCPVRRGAARAERA